MIKKLVIWGVVGVVGWNAVKNTRFASHVRTEIASIRKTVDDNTSPEKDLARIKTDIKLLDLEIQRAIKPLAAENVKVRDLKEQVVDQQAKLSKAKDVLQARAAAIKSATENVTFGERTLSVNAATAELEQGVKRYTSSQKSLESMELTLASRERIRDGLEKQLEALRTQKIELAAAVDALEAEVMLLKVKQTESQRPTDNTHLARVKEDIRNLKTKVAVQREELKLLPSAFDDAGTPAATTKSVDDIMAPLSGAKSAAKKTDAMPTAID